MGLGFLPFNLSVQSRMPVSGRNASCEPDLIVQGTVDIEKMVTHAGTLTSKTILWPGPNNLSVRVRVGVRFPFKF